MRIPKNWDMVFNVNPKNLVFLVFKEETPSDAPNS